MRKRKCNLLRFAAVGIVLCLSVFIACENDTGGNGNTENETGNETESTFIEFRNLEQFPVTVYSDSGREIIFARVSGKDSTKVKAEPNQIGIPFYLTYHVILEGVEIPYNSPGAIVVRVDENKTNIANINQLSSISSASAYIKIQNSSTDTLVLRNNNTEMRPIGAVSTIITAGEGGAYQISPGSVSVFSFMKNATIPVPFPGSLVSFEAGYMYSFVFNGSSLVLDIVPVDITIARMGTLRTLADMLAWLNNNAENGGIYTLYVRIDDEIDPTTLSYNGKDVTIILRTIYEGNELKINLKRNGSLFYVGNNVKLILDAGIVLQGRTGNYAALIRVNDGGTFTMNGGKITGNSSSSSSSSSDDSNSYGGGVYVDSGTFIMNNGEISENSSSSSSSSSGRSSSYGGGVYVDSGTFTMNGGEVYGNTAYAYGRHYAYANGGGVYVSGGTFTMNGGKISGNTATSRALETVGQYVYRPYSYGGGVCVQNGGIFNMNDGEISENTTPSSGPSSYSGDSYGGGVYVSGTFRMSGGVIYGNNAETDLENTASEGATLYRAGTAQYGTFSGDTFYSSGNLTSTDTTIRVVNGNLLTE